MKSILSMISFSESTISCWIATITLEIWRAQLSRSPSWIADCLSQMKMTGARFASWALKVLRLYVRELVTSTCIISRTRWLRSSKQIQNELASLGRSAEYPVMNRFNTKEANFKKLPKTSRRTWSALQRVPDNLWRIDKCKVRQDQYLASVTLEQLRILSSR